MYPVSVPLREVPCPALPCPALPYTPIPLPQRCCSFITFCILVVANIIMRAFGMRCYVLESRNESKECLEVQFLLQKKTISFEQQRPIFLLYCGREGRGEEGGNNFQTRHPRCIFIRLVILTDYYICFLGPRYLSRYSDSLRAGRSGYRISMGARFSAPVQTGHGAHPASYAMGTGSFQGVKRPGRGADHPPPYSADVKERVELYLYFTSGPSWPVIG